MKAIAITGARDFADTRSVITAIDAQVARYLKQNPDEDMRLYVGDCPTGADRIATAHWNFMHRQYGKPLIFVADWKNLGSTAGPARNKKMIDYGPDVLLAFVKTCEKPNCPRKPAEHPSHGTWSTIKFAQKAAIETLEYTESFTPNYFESTFYQENYLRNLARAANVYEIFCTYYPEQLIAIVD